jgi:hypothetical protein
VNFRSAFFMWNADGCYQSLFPHHYSIISLLYHTEMYSETDVVSVLFFLKRRFSHTEDTVPCTEYINTPQCLYWEDTEKEVYLLKMKTVSIYFLFFFDLTLVHLNSFEVRMHFSCYSVLYPSHICCSVVTVTLAM